MWIAKARDSRCASCSRSSSMPRSISRCSSGGSRVGASRGFCARKFRMAALPGGARTAAGSGGAPAAARRACCAIATPGANRVRGGASGLVATGIAAGFLGPAGFIPTGGSSPALDCRRITCRPAATGRSLPRAELGAELGAELRAEEGAEVGVGRRAPTPAAAIPLPFRALAPAASLLWTVGTGGGRVRSLATGAAAALPLISSGAIATAELFVGRVERMLGRAEAFLFAAALARSAPFVQI